LHTAADLTSLNEDSVQPFYLKIAVQLYDSKGQPSEQGSVEEWWAGNGREKRVYTMPSYTATEVRDDKSVYRTSGASYPPEMPQTLLLQVLHPMPQQDEVDGSHPELKTLRFGKIPLDCIMVAQPIAGMRNAPMGLFPTYCFDPGQESLRLTYNFGTEVIVRNGVGKFQQKSVPIDVVVRSGDVLSATGHIVALATHPVTDEELSTNGLAAVGHDVVPLSDSSVQGLRLSAVAPRYPSQANMNHVSGTVVLAALIGTDGRVHKLSVVSTPDADLAVAALAAVREWTYKPYVVNGVPVEVTTRINVNFAFN
jgi:TonB family protein